MRKLAAAVLAAGLLIAQSAWAEDKIADVTDMDALRAAVRADKKALVAATLKLTPQEAKRFWPIYDTYQRSVDVANRRRSLAVQAIAGLDQPISDLYARNLANELIGADEEEVRARRALTNRLMRGVPTRVMPPRKAARYLQLESKIRAMQAYDIATGIPLVK
jgi:ribosomal protein S7